MSNNSLGAAENFRGCMYMLLAMASFAVGDTILKYVSDHLAFSQILVIRGLIACVIIATATYYFRQMRSFKTIANVPFLLRLLGEVIATAFFLTALFNMPIANASAIMQALPLTVSLGAAYFLGETIGWRRIVAIMIGLLGVLMIVQPGLEGFNAYSMYCLLAVAGTTLRDLATRRLASDIPSLFVSLVTVIVITIGGMLLSLTEDWKATEPRDYLALAFAAVFMISGYFAIISAMRFGEVGVVTPFRYSVLIFAVILGYFVFAEIPDTLTTIGSIIVVASGIYTIYRERIRAQETPLKS